METELHHCSGFSSCSLALLLIALHLHSDLIPEQACKMEALLGGEMCMCVCTVFCLMPKTAWAGEGEGVTEAVRYNRSTNHWSCLTKERTTQPQGTYF